MQLITPSRFPLPFRDAARGALLALAAAACDGAELGGPDALEVTPARSSVECLVGQTVELDVTARGGTGAVTLSATAQNGSVTAAPRSAGVVIGCASAGTTAVTITATAGGRTATSVVSVSVSTPPPLAVTLQPAAIDCMAGDTVALAIGVTGGIGAPTLTLGSTAGAASVTHATRGATVACAAAGRAEVIVAAASGAQTVIDTVPVVVAPLVPLTLALEPAQVTCVLGETVSVSVRAEGSRSGRPAVTFATNDARIGLTASGATAAVRCNAPGRVTVAVSAAEGLQRGSATLPVTVTLRPQTVVLFATPKFVRDFDAPEASVDRFLDHYAPLTTRAAETIVIYAVGNSEHVLTYRGAGAMGDSLKWARYVDGKLPGDPRPMFYRQVARTVRALKERAAARGLTLKVFDQVDPGNEFVFEVWKYDIHPECMDRRWDSFDVRARLRADSRVYASAPQGIAEGTPCGTFLVNQAGEYLRDLGFDGLLYGNQFGTRGRWLPDNGPGYSDAEAAGIRDFLAYSRRTFGARQLMWFDTYNNTRVERDVYSFPSDGYQYFDYLMASGFAVVSNPTRYLDNLRSKLAIPAAIRPRILATLDYVDPWYSYNSMTDYADESTRLEAIAIEHRDRVDGLVFFANDDDGSLVPRALIQSFATRYFGAP